MTAPLEREPAELLYQHLMELHGQLFAVERYEAAYHVLAAGLHVAEELDEDDVERLGVIERLGIIERLARKRQADVDCFLPVHPMASASARGRGNTARFHSLALMAKAAGARARADRALQRSRATGSL
jgi:hypothetical protein